jgi:hypothetical protein
MSMALRPVRERQMALKVESTSARGKSTRVLLGLFTGANAVLGLGVVAFYVA